MVEACAPRLSVTVSVTVFAPTFEQSKSVLLKDRVIPQASLDPLSTNAAVVLPFFVPAPSAFLVVFILGVDE